jgi:uncharacterized protein (TIGR02996 family)
MGEETAFIRAILSNPGDVASRLVYADWLEERGDSRGEFLRLLSSLAEPSIPEDRKQTLRNRLAAVQVNLDPRWVTLMQLQRIPEQ